MARRAASALSSSPTGRCRRATARSRRCGRSSSASGSSRRTSSTRSRSCRPTGWLDDARFAERFAEDKRELERWGSERIERDLQRRGVPPDLIAPALGAARTATTSSPRRRAARRASIRRASRDDRERDRAWRLLVRKGYEPELAYEAVRAHGRTCRGLIARCHSCGRAQGYPPVEAACGRRESELNLETLICSGFELPGSIDFDLEPVDRLTSATGREERPGPSLTPDARALGRRASAVRLAAPAAPNGEPDPAAKPG